MIRSAAVLCTVALVVASASAVPQGRQNADPQGRQNIAPAGLVGTWTLVSVEQGVGGTPTRAANPRGLLIFDAAGHVFEYVAHTPRTPADAIQAQQTLAGTSGFWGRYRADADSGRLTLEPAGGVVPNLMGASIVRRFERTGDRLTVTSVSGEPLREGTTRWTWEQVPHVEHLSPAYRGIVGFWQHVVEKRVNLTTGTTISESQRSPSIIVYTPSGYVGVHFPPLNRQPFAGTMPTDEEARAAMSGYVGYFGALGVYPGMVFHQVLAGISPAAGSTLKRFYDVDGDQVMIRFPPALNAQGQETTTLVTLRRLSGAREMLAEDAAP